jgi:hypothetical protein
MAGRVTPVAAAALISAFRQPRGGWRVQRRITGTPLAADFEGTASWTAAPLSLANAVAAGTTCSRSAECAAPGSAACADVLALYTEVGILSSPALPHPMEATRSYGYGVANGGGDSPHVLRLVFDDGRPFVDLDLAADVDPKVLGQDLPTVDTVGHAKQCDASFRVVVAQGEHLCSEDLYRATFAFVIDDRRAVGDSADDGAPSWTLSRCTMIFDVRGPAKDYRSVSHLTPLA